MHPHENPRGSKKSQDHHATKQFESLPAQLCYPSPSVFSLLSLWRNHRMYNACHSGETCLDISLSLHPCLSTSSLCFSDRLCWFWLWIVCVHWWLTVDLLSEQPSMLWVRRSSLRITAALISRRPTDCWYTSPSQSYSISAVLEVRG